MILESEEVRWGRVGERERGREKERERERNIDVREKHQLAISCLQKVPQLGSNPRPRYVF